MKKLNLKSLNFEANNMLQRHELKMVFGGYNFADCTAVCDGGETVSCSGFTCTAVDGEGCTGYEGGDPYEELCPVV